MRLMNLRPQRPLAVLLALLPFIALLLLYMTASDARLAENPNDKLLPSMQSMVDAVQRLAFEEDRRSGEYIFWSDTAASLQRLLIGIGISASMALLAGVLLGTLPLARAVAGPVVAVVSMVPPLAILPILFIVFGLGELSKVVLIVIGTAPVMIRDMTQRVLDLPPEQAIKLQTLGGSSWHLMLRVVLPQVLPRLLSVIRLCLGSAWLFLIAAEAIAATEGLGYRIFLVRRYLSMDVILPYVLWITLLAWVMDLGLRKTSQLMFPWFHAGQERNA
ncbi:ABC transporter permease [Alcanivorax sp. S71-1-4]|uniref:ABC transporter permease n=1 Tax=Alcanivorax sp. S71-1-4 TaxID=1177159 RepID=UPI0013597771|nr:ABC transporter permease subunit [Alcanivorax sp. S71-1-4]KAF0806954.1 ABC transporter permease [Alcanivorax sp. S71-1-4]